MNVVMLQMSMCCIPAEYGASELYVMAIKKSSLWKKRFYDGNQGGIFYTDNVEISVIHTVNLFFTVCKKEKYRSKEKQKILYEACLKHLIVPQITYSGA